MTAADMNEALASLANSYGVPRRLVELRLAPEFWVVRVKRHEDDTPLLTVKEDGLEQLCALVLQIARSMRVRNGLGGQVSKV